MLNRTCLSLGLAITLAIAAPRGAQAEGTTMKWTAGSAPTTSGSAEEAIQLARQASELAARAAEMAAAAQSGSARDTKSTAAAASAPSLATASGAAQAEASAPAQASALADSATADAAAPQEWKNSGQGPKVFDIRFQDGTLATATDIPLPTIEPIVPVPPASTPIEPVKSGDNQVQLAANTYSDTALFHVAQLEPAPASTSTLPTNTLPNDPSLTQNYDGSFYGDDCCPPQRVLFWTGGVEATFLNPDLNSDGAYFAVEDTYEGREDIFTSQSNDVDSLYISPRIWIGIQGCLWGANLRYWHLQASEGTYDPTIGKLGTWDDYDCGVPDMGFFTCNRLEAYTVDLEVTRRFCLNDCWMQASVGVRHAEVEHSESITGLAITDSGLLEGFAHADRRSRGTGLLFGLYGRKPVFPCSTVHWFYNVRWSALWGPTQTAAETYASVQSNDPDFTASAASVNGAYTNVDDTLFIGEIQVGLEWNYALVCVPANAFFRAAIEYQRWDGGPGVSGANSFAGITIDGDTEASSLVSSTAGAQSPQMDLVGFTIGTGLTW